MWKCKLPRSGFEHWLLYPLPMMISIISEAPPVWLPGCIHVVCFNAYVSSYGCIYICGCRICLLVCGRGRCLRECVCVYVCVYVLSKRFIPNTLFRESFQKLFRYDIQFSHRTVWGRLEWIMKQGSDFEADRLLNNKIGLNVFMKISYQSLEAILSIRSQKMWHSKLIGFLSKERKGRWHTTNIAVNASRLMPEHFMWSVNWLVKRNYHVEIFPSDRISFYLKNSKVNIRPIWIRNYDHHLHIADSNHLHIVDINNDNDNICIYIYIYIYIYMCVCVCVIPRIYLYEITRTHTHIHIDR